MPKGIYKRNAKDAATQTAAPPVKRGRKPKPSGGSSATLQLAGRTIQVRIDESGAIHVSVLTP